MQNISLINDFSCFCDKIIIAPLPEETCTEKIETELLENSKKIPNQLEVRENKLNRPVNPSHLIHRTWANLDEDEYC